MMTGSGGLRASQTATYVTYGFLLKCSKAIPVPIQLIGVCTCYHGHPCAVLQVLIEFPCELVSAVVAGRWAASSSPFKPFLFGYQARVIMAAVVTSIVSHTLWSSLVRHAGSQSWTNRIRKLTAGLLKIQWAPRTCKWQLLHDSPTHAVWHGNTAFTSLHVSKSCLQQRCLSKQATGVIVSRFTLSKQ